MRHNADLPGGGFVTTLETPARLASIESDVSVPVLQALAVGLSVGLAAGVGVLLLGGPLAGLQGRGLWSWAARIGGVGAALALAGCVVLFILSHRRALWAREVMRGEDLDGDGAIGRPAPEVVRVVLESADGRHQQIVDLPASREELGRLALAVLRNGRAFSRPGLRGIVSQATYRRLAAEMVRRGLAVELPGNKRELTGAGRAILRKFVV